MEYPYSALPEATRMHIDRLRMALAGAAGRGATRNVAVATRNVAAGGGDLARADGGSTALVVRTPRVLPARPAVTELDRVRRDAVAILCRAVEAEAMDTGCAALGACLAVADKLCRRELDAAVQKAAETAYIKARGGEYLGGAAALGARLQRHMVAFRRGAAEGDPPAQRQHPRAIRRRAERAGHRPGTPSHRALGVRHSGAQQRRRCADGAVLGCGA